MVQSEDLLLCPVSYHNSNPRKNRIRIFWFNRNNFTPSLSPPAQLFFALVYSSITYFMTDQIPETDRFLKFVAVYMVVTVAADAFGTFLGTIINPVVR